MSAQSCDMLTSGRLSERDRQTDRRGGGAHAGEEEEEEEEAHTEEDLWRSEKTVGCFLAEGFQLLNSDRRNSGREAPLWYGYMGGRGGTGRGKWRDEDGLLGRGTTGEGMKHGGEREVKDQRLFLGRDLAAGKVWCHSPSWCRLLDSWRTAERNLGARSRRRSSSSCGTKPRGGYQRDGSSRRSPPPPSWCAHLTFFPCSVIFVMFRMPHF